ncbi:MAG: class I SAM-dependent methyltransferase [Anaerolineales bacterium]|nr:class I SAM-dependent methyltransferase [Anaerolineales bacterium]
MGSKSAKYYDDIYAANSKDYPAEAGLTHQIIQQYKISSGNSLLDVGCGTGIHVNLLRKHYQVEGLDIDPYMLHEARRNHPGIRFHQGDMVDFRLENTFDVIVCLFSAIGYVKTKPRLHKAIKTMASHLNTGGVLLIEPWFTPSQWHTGRSFTTLSSKPDTKIFRMSYSRRRGNISIIEFQYLIGTSKGIEHEKEILELGLFNKKDYLNAFRLAGLKTFHDPQGLDGRGLYIGIKA